MQHTTTGFDSITSIPSGATITAVYWTMSNTYGYVGDPHDTQADALETAIEDRRRVLKNLNRGDWRPEKLNIEMRWTVNYETGGSIDLAVHAVQYPTLADAVEHLALLRKWETTT